MSTISITNNTQLPLHAATEWNRIVQEFKNNILPGETVNLAAANFGWQDLMVVTGVKENEISHKSDWASALGFGALVAGAAATVAGVALTIVTAGAAAPAAVGAATITARLIASGVVAGLGVAVLGGRAATMIAGFILKPATVSGLWGPDGYDITATGGEVIGEFDQKTETFTSTEVTPLVITWKNKTSGTHGVIGKTR